MPVSAASLTSLLETQLALVSLECVPGLLPWQKAGLGVTPCLSTLPV